MLEKKLQNSSPDARIGGWLRQRIWAWPRDVGKNEKLPWGVSRRGARRKESSADDVDVARLLPPLFFFAKCQCCHRQRPKVLRKFYVTKWIFCTDGRLPFPAHIPRRAQFNYGYNISSREHACPTVQCNFNPAKARHLVFIAILSLSAATVNRNRKLHALGNDWGSTSRRGTTWFMKHLNPLPSFLSSFLISFLPFPLAHLKDPTGDEERRRYTPCGLAPFCRWRRGPHTNAL